MHNQSRNGEANNLINEKSPYLLQHAYNPVLWHSWNEETLKKARAEDKPIFLSIGYSTCYWCHVMEREVFENPEIAKMMNESFINVKVDREERPDIDRIYMTALQAMTGSGGWPMSMFLTPELKPFYGATYVPPRAKYGRAGFEDIIEQISSLWKEKKNEIRESGDKILAILKKSLEEKEKKTAETLPGKEIFDKAFSQVTNIYDDEYGGFGSGNKFPRPCVYDLLLNYYYHTKNFEALDIVTFTLKKMYEGGMYDHLGGGFHRYSVDNVWRVPHFEKMLYDQAQLVTTYLDTFNLTVKELYKEVAVDTLEYVLNDLLDSSGGFYSAEDAESAIEPDKPDEKEEGAFYLWTKYEIDEILGKDDAAVFNYMFGVEAKGNTINDPHNVFKIKNVLYLSHDVHDTAKKFGRNPDEIEKIIGDSKRNLLEIRNKRLRPHHDDKILTSWNGLMISAFAKAYQILNEEKYLDAGKNAAKFILENLTEDGELLHRFRESEAKFKGNLEDYSFFIQGLIDLYEASFEIEYLKKAIELNNKCIGLFYDNDKGGFYDVRKNEKDIILETKDSYDGAEPSGNSVQIKNLLRLAIFTGNSEYTEKAERSLKLFANDLEKMPFSSPAMLNSLSFLIQSPKEIIISGEKNEKFYEFVREINEKYIPNKVLIHAADEMINILQFLNNILTEENKEAVYICENYTCNLPVTNKEELQEQLK